MRNDGLRQFAMLQLERMASSIQADDPIQDRIWAALYCVQAMDEGPMPDDFSDVIHIANEMDSEES
jgi:hypothetical protein